MDSPSSNSLTAPATARKAQSLGATTLVDVDVSSEMINIAHKIEKGMGVTGINYYVSDSSKPIDALKGQEGKFDLVLENWLLNYATTFNKIVGMLEQHRPLS
jgi:hypothetical protein